MDVSSIWWTQVGSSVRLLERIVERLRGERSFTLVLPQPLAWPDTFYALVKDHACSISAERTLHYAVYDGSSDPGDFVLQEFCPPEFRARYWPGDSCAEYLCQGEKLLFSSCFVWIKGIQTRAALRAWQTFVADYEKAAAALPIHAVFVLEYSGAPVDDSGEALLYQPTERDCRIFCLQAADCGDPALDIYLAELALKLGRGVPELSGRLLTLGTRLLQDPRGAALSLEGALSSTGDPLPVLSDAFVRSAVWEAQIAWVFPLLERFRVRVVDQYADRLFPRLPIPNSNGDPICVPYDLEFGALYFLGSTGGVFYRSEDFNGIILCRDARNTLAHNNFLSYASICELLRQLSA